MNKLKNNKLVAISAAIGGLIVGVLITLSVYQGKSWGDKQAKIEKIPLYWVAPMDPNYRRDEPGKSPMGMDLIPVFEEGTGVNDAGPGTINISPDVVNNLGVRTATVARKKLQEEIVTVGYVQYDENRLVHIHPRVSGWVEKLYTKAAGYPVTKGEPLYSLYSPELVNAQEELVLAINRSNTRLIQAAEDRLRALQISEEFIKNLKRTLVIKQTVNFYAPQSGVIDSLSIREGFYVEPSTTMLSIGALDRVWVEAEVFESQSAQVKLNDSVTMTLDYLPGKKWTGNVKYIYPTLDSKTRTARVRLSFDNPQGELKPNMFAQVIIHNENPEPLLVIPREALIRTGNQDRVVLALGAGSFKSVTVQAGRSNQTFFEIIEGLKEGERIVTSAQFLLDSESSKTSDFKRIHHADERPTSVWVSAEVLSVMADHRMISVSHEAIEQWQWPAMVMDFNVSSKVDIDSLTVGMSLHIEIETLDENQYEVSAIHIQEGSAELQAIDEHDSESHESESQSRQNNQQDKE